MAFLRQSGQRIPDEERHLAGFDRRQQARCIETVPGLREQVLALKYPFIEAETAGHAPHPLCGHLRANSNRRLDGH
jgi:hypothetical protein